jgi:hypothetical protein
MGDTSLPAAATAQAGKKKPQDEFSPTPDGAVRQLSRVRLVWGFSESCPNKTSLFHRFFDGQARRLFGRVRPGW